MRSTYRDAFHISPFVLLICVYIAQSYLAFTFVIWVNMILDILYKERHFIKEGDLTFEFFLIKEMSSFLYLCASICSFVKKKFRVFVWALMAIVLIHMLWLISDSKPIKWNNDNAMFVIVQKKIYFPIPYKFINSRLSIKYV